METKKKTAAKKAAQKDVKKLKVLITVVNRNKTEFYTDLLSGFDVNFQFVALGEGTAKSDTLYLLGLEDSEKGVIFSVIREDKETEILQKIEEKFETLKNGKGIAFTLPMSSVIGVAIYRFLSNHRA